MSDVNPSLSDADRNVMTSDKKDLGAAQGNISHRITALLKKVIIYNVYVGLDLSPAS